MEKIRALVLKDPVHYTTVKISKDFKLSVEAVGRILKSKYIPDKKAAERQERNRYKAMGERQEAFRKLGQSEGNSQQSQPGEIKKQGQFEESNLQRQRSAFKKPDYFKNNKPQNQRDEFRKQNRFRENDSHTSHNAFKKNGQFKDNRGQNQFRDQGKRVPFK